MPFHKRVDGEPHRAHAAVFVEALGVDGFFAANDVAKLGQYETVDGIGFRHPGIDQHAVTGRNEFEGHVIYLPAD